MPDDGARLSPFDELLAQAGGDPEREALRRLREECGLDRDDPVFRLFLVQGHYWSRFWRQADGTAEGFGERCKTLLAELESAAQDRLDGVAYEAAGRMVEAAQAAIVDEVQAIAGEAVQATRAVAARGRWLAFCWAFGVAACMLAVAFLAGDRWGRADIRADLESERVKWVLTEAGEQAHAHAVDGLLAWFREPAGERFLEMRKEGKLDWLLSDAGAEARFDLEGLLPDWRPIHVDALVAFAGNGSLGLVMSCMGWGWKRVLADDGAVWCVVAPEVSWRLPWRHDCSMFQAALGRTVKHDDVEFCL